MDPIKVDFSKNGGKGTKDTVIPPDKAGLKIVLSLVFSAIVAAVGYYFLMPALNFKSYDLYIYIALVLASYVVANGLFARVLTRPEYVPYVRKRATVPIIIAAVFGLVLVVGYVISAPLFRAKSYSRIITVNEVDETVTDETVKKITNIESIEDFNQIALIDSVAAEKLADKTLGTLAQLGLESQFDVLNTYSTQINYKNAPYRVFPLKYGDIFKWLKNRSSGTAGYVTVNMNTQKAEFIKTDEGIKYTPAEHFNRLLRRVVRFAYPTYILGATSFEIDEQGNAYWIVQHIDKTVGLFGGDDVVGIIVVNAYTGECSEYNIDEVESGTAADGTYLEWIDAVFDGGLLVKQYNYCYEYSNGFINRYIGQENVKLTTAGYSFLTDGNDVYMYTGVTSANADESILGFALVNQRTKEAFFYSVSGATEAAAQGSAQGIVSDKGWTATFPLLVNLRTSDGGYEPTYFMALKDSTDIVKSYAMVNVGQYSDAVRSPSDDNPDLKACLSAYVSKLSSRSTPVSINVSMSGKLNTEAPADEKPQDNNSVTGVVSFKEPVVISGNTYYYITLAGSETLYRITATLDGDEIFIGAGDTVTLTFVDTESDIINVVSLEKAGAAQEPVTVGETAEVEG